MNSTYTQAGAVAALPGLAAGYLLGIVNPLLALAGPAYPITGEFRDALIGVVAGLFAHHVSRIAYGPSTSPAPKA